MTQVAETPLLQREGIRQFVKFCLIGATSTLIDGSIAYFLTYHFGMNLTLAKSISFLFGVTNGYIWNSRWTFRGQSSGAAHAMYMKFVGVNVVGFVINLTVFKSIIFLFTGRLIGQGRPPKPQFLAAYLVATIITAVWNFLANKKWTFNG